MGVSIGESRVRFPSGPSDGLRLALPLAEKAGSMPVTSTNLGANSNQKNSSIK